MTTSDVDSDEDSIIVYQGHGIIRIERGSRRAVLDSPSFHAQDNNLSQEQHVPVQQCRPPRVILSSDEEDRDKPNTKRRRRPTVANNEEDDTSSGEEAGNCAICFEAYTVSGSHRIVCLKCGHLFGQSCIERWIRTERNARCPQCKARARIGDIRRLYANAIKVLDTTELEKLKEANNAYKAENESLRLENEHLKAEIAKAEACKTASQSATPAVEMNTKPQPFSLITGPTVSLSSEPGSRSLDVNGECFVVSCKIRNDLFMPYGLKLITIDGREDTLIPVHSKKPRCCAFSPFDRHIVLSTGEDKTLCVTSFGDSPAVLHRIELPAAGWSCCWLSMDEVAVGLVSGRVLKFNLLDPTVEPFDITGNNGRLPIISLQSSANQSLLFVVSLKECVLYHHMQPHVLISDQGAINSFCYDKESCSVMVTFAPGEHHETVTHVMYKLELTGEKKELRHFRTYKSCSKKLTRMIKSAFWNTLYGPLAAVFDEANSQLVLFDWMRNRAEVFKRIKDNIVAIKEIATDDPQRFRLGCLSETAVHFFEARC